eukprot:scaffold28216_cov31-Tisochrysis_lutea.AAC.3
MGCLPCAAGQKVGSGQGHLGCDDGLRNANELVRGRWWSWRAEHEVGEDGRRHERHRRRPGHRGAGASSLTNIGPLCLTTRSSAGSDGEVLFHPLLEHAHACGRFGGHSRLTCRARRDAVVIARHAKGHGSISVACSSPRVGPNVFTASPAAAGAVDTQKDGSGFGIGRNAVRVGDTGRAMSAVTALVDTSQEMHGAATTAAPGTAWPAMLNAKATGSASSVAPPMCTAKTGGSLNPTGSNLACRASHNPEDWVLGPSILAHSTPNPPPSLDLLHRQWPLQASARLEPEASPHIDGACRRQLQRRGLILGASNRYGRRPGQPSRQCIATAVVSHETRPIFLRVDRAMHNASVGETRVPSPEPPRALWWSRRRRKRSRDNARPHRPEHVREVRCSLDLCSSTGQKTLKPTQPAPTVRPYALRGGAGEPAEQGNVHS